MSAVFQPINPFEQALIDSLPIEVLINLTSNSPTKTSNKKSGSLPERSGHRLRLHLFEARDLPSISWFAKDKTDSYVTISLQGTKTSVKTQVITETTHPTFNEAWDFHLSRNPLQDVLLVNVFAHHSITSDDFLGRVEVPLSMILSLPAPRKMPSCWFPLLPNFPAFTAPNTKVGSIRIGFEYFFDPSEAQLRFLQDQATALAVLDSRKQSLPSPNHVIRSVPYVSTTPIPAALIAQQLGQPSTMGFPAHSTRKPATPVEAMSSSERCVVCNCLIPSERLAQHVENHFADSESTMAAPPTSVVSSVSESMMMMTPPGYRPIYPTSASASLSPQIISSIGGENHKYPLPTRPVPPPPPSFSSPSSSPLVNLNETPQDIEARDLAEAIRQSEEFARTEQLRQLVPHDGTIDHVKPRDIANLSSTEASLMDDLQSALQRRNQSNHPSAPSSPPPPAYSQVPLPFPPPLAPHPNLAGSYMFPNPNYYPNPALYPSIPAPYGVLPLSQMS